MDNEEKHEALNMNTSRESWQLRDSRHRNPEWDHFSFAINFCMFAFLKTNDKNQEYDNEKVIFTGGDGVNDT
jgi:hypothetical protein